MLKEAAITKISTLLKVDQAKLKAALTDANEADIEIPDDLTVYTKTELDTFQKNKYESGKAAGQGMLIDELFTEHGIQGAKKDKATFLTEYEKKILASANISVDDKVKEKDKQLEQAKKLLKEANEKADGFKNQMELFQGDSKLLSMLPSNRIESMTNEEYLTLTKSAIKIEVRDGKEVAIRNGQVVVDKVLEPVPPSKVISDYYTERKWIKEPVDDKKGGRGGGNSNPGGAGSKLAKISELHKQLQDEGISLNGEEASRRTAAAMKENPDIDMNS